MQAMELPEEQWASLLDRTCGGDPALTLKARQLLRYSESGTGFLEGSAFDSLEPYFATSTDDHLEPDSRRRYEILRALSSGGMGTVYEAMQIHTGRRVALKTLNEGSASSRLLGVVERESRILARLQHPGIAQIYECGQDLDCIGDVPWLAMEFVPDAVPITDYAGIKKLRAVERLRLFLDVCEAVDYGHQKGIIHRDLKPANILIDSANPEPVPKVIDFGVARITDPDLDIKTIFSDRNKIIGTLQYMSPEQCSDRPDLVDTRSDVYSLGVVLYELLCGRLPYNLKGIPFSKALSIVQEGVPRRMTAKEMHLSCDIESIAIKALEKDPEQRYQSVSEFARDIQRYLDHEPVEARPPSLAYRLSLFVRRNKLLVSAAALIVVILIAAIVVSTRYAILAERKAVEADRNATSAALSATEADQRAEEAQQVVRFLRGILTFTDPRKAKSTTITVHELLSRADRGSELEFDRQPPVEMVVQSIIGESYLSFGSFDEAEVHLNNALKLARSIASGSNQNELNISKNLADLYRNTGRYEEAESLYVETLEGFRELYQTDHHQSVLATLNALALLYQVEGNFERAETFCRRTLQGFEELHGETHPGTTDALINLASILISRGKLGEAERMLTGLIDKKFSVFGDGDPRLFDTYNSLAVLLMNQGLVKKAEALLRDALQGSTSALGADHPESLTYLANLASNLERQGNFDEAERLLNQLREKEERVFGKNHPRLLYTLNTLACLHANRGDAVKAESVLREAIDVGRRSLGEDHPSTLNTMANLAMLIARTGSYQEAQELLRGVLESRKKVLGEGHHQVVDTMNKLGVVLMNGGSIEKAQSLLEKTLELVPAESDSDELLRLDALNNLAIIAVRRGSEKDHKIAEGYFKEALFGYRRLMGDDAFLTVRIMYNLAYLCYVDQRYSEAQDYIKEVLEKSGPEHPDYQLAKDLAESIRAAKTDGK